MTYPLSVDENGVKIKPENMEKEKMYYCVHGDKILLVYKDDQEFLNCYEIEEKELVESVRMCTDSSKIETIIENYIQKTSNIK